MTWDPVRTDDVQLIMLRSARQAWNGLLELSIAKDRLIAHGKSTEEIDKDIAGVNDVILETEGKLRAMGYRPRWMEPPDDRPKEEKPKKKKPKRPPHQAWRQLLDQGTLL